MIAGALIGGLIAKERGAILAGLVITGAMFWSAERAGGKVLPVRPALWDREADGG